MNRITLTGHRTVVRTAPGSDVAHLANDSDITLCDLTAIYSIELTAGSEKVGFIQIRGERGPTFVSIAIVPTLRGHGLGSEAVRLLEKHLAPDSSTFRALVSRSRGLALYFWLRLGYRPTTDHRAAEYRDVITMLRET